MQLDHDEAVLLARLLGHHFTAHTEPCNRLSTQVQALTNKLLDYARRNDGDFLYPLPGLMLAPVNQDAPGRIVLAFKPLYSPKGGTFPEGNA